MILIFPNSKYLDKNRLFSGGGDAENLAQLLRAFDTGIESIHLSWAAAEDVLDSLSEKARLALLKDVEKILSVSSEDGKKPAAVDVPISGMYIRFKKEGNQLFATQLLMNHGNTRELFEMWEESDGTQRLFDLIPVYSVARQPRVVMVDELDRSFHTKLVWQYIKSFYALTKGVGSQLIATVHDANVMDLELLRQDEIWFVERMADHASRLYPLSIYKERFDKKISKDYLLGRYGAIPCLEQSTLETEEA